MNVRGRGRKKHLLGKNKRSFPPLTFRLRFVVPVKGRMCAGIGVDLASNAPCVEKQRAL